MTTITLARSIPAPVTRLDRIFIATANALLRMIASRHNAQRIAAVEHSADARRDASAFRHLGLLPR